LPSLIASKVSQLNSATAGSIRSRGGPHAHACRPTHSRAALSLPAADRDLLEKLARASNRPSVERRTLMRVGGQGGGRSRRVHGLGKPTPPRPASIFEER